jgi:integrase
MVFSILSILIKVISERLGHAGIGITLDLYSHVALGMQQATAKKFDEIVLTKTLTGID